jgi:hypothetical protein
VSVAPVARGAWFWLNTPRPRAFARGRAERHCSGACPQQTRHPQAPPISPLGRPVYGSCPEPGAGKRRFGQVHRNNQRWWQLLWVTTGSHPRGARSAGRPSAAERPVGRLPQLGGRVGPWFGVEPRICAMARVTYESKDHAGPQVLGGPLRPLHHPDRRHPPRRLPVAHHSGGPLDPQWCRPRP